MIVVFLLQTFWRHTRSRLLALLQACPLVSPLPVAIVTLGCHETEEELGQCLGLAELGRGGWVSEYRVVRLGEDVESPTASEQVRWLRWFIYLDVFPLFF